MVKSSSGIRRISIKYQYSSLVAAVLLGVGSFACFITAFGLRYSVKSALRGGMISGLIGCANQMADAVGKSRFILWTRYEGAGEYGVFLTILLVLMVAFAYCLLRSRMRVLLLIYVLPVIGCSVILGLSPSVPAVILLFFGLLLGYAAMRLGERFQWETAVLLVIPMVILLVVGSVDASRTLFNPTKAVRSMSAAAQNGVDQLRYGRNPLGDGTLEVDLRDRDQVAMTVTMSDPQAMYLRGYIGEKYSGGRWHALSNSTHYAMYDTTAALEQSGFDGRSQLARSMQLSGMTATENQMTIQVTHASKKYVYMPYEYSGGLPETGRNWNSSFVTADGLWGDKTYNYSSTQNLTGEWTDLVGKLYSAKTSAEFDAYVRQESHYNTMVYSHYTGVDDETYYMLSEEIGSRGNQETGHVDYKTAISKVLEYFDNNILYVNPDESAENSLDALFQYHKGNDVGCATAATMMFRYFGIPARYVEGYLVTEEDAEHMSPEGEYDLPFSRAHAWTEIYIDGMGWVPIEVTQAYRDQMPQADMSRGLETDSQNNPFDQPESAAQNVLETADDESSESFPWIYVLLALLGFLLMIAFAYAGWRISKRIRAKRKRNAAFRQPDVNRAICAMYDYAGDCGYVLPDELKDIGLAAAYSPIVYTENERERYLKFLDEEARNQKKNRSWKFNANFRTRFFRKSK